MEQRIAKDLLDLRSQILQVGISVVADNACKDAAVSRLSRLRQSH